MRCALFSATFMALASSPVFAQGDGEELWSQAAEYYDADDFARSRREAMQEQGGLTAYRVFGERLEYRTNDGSPALLFEGEAWWGGDRNKLWLKSDVEYDFDADRFEDAEIQALWSRPISPYFNFQAGVRRDFKPDPSRNYAVIGVEGLAPYWFELDAAFFVSGHGDVTARIEAEYEFLITQRLVLQPRTELNFAAQSVDALGIGSGLSTAEVGARLRYEIKRQFAPYVGVSWERSVGETADFARAAGEDVGAVSAVAGLQFWF